MDDFKKVQILPVRSIYNALADPKTALKQHEKALPFLYQLNDKTGAATTLNNIGDIDVAIGKPQEALKSYSQAIAISRANASLAQEADGLTNISNLYMTSQNWETALFGYKQALLITRHLKDTIKETSILNQMGRIQAALGNPDTAQEYYTQALTLSRQLGFQTEEADILYNQALLYRQQGNLPEAKTDIETAIEIVEGLRTNIESKDLRTSYFSTVQNYYQFYIDLLMELHQQQPNKGYDALALQVSERSRARSLLELLTEANLDIRQGVDPDLLAEEQRLTEQLGLKEKERLDLVSTSYAQSDLDQLKGEIDNILKQLSVVEVRIRQNSPTYANLKYPQALSLEEIQQNILDDDTLLLEYALGEERSYLFVVGKNSFTTHTLPPRAEIEGEVDDYLKFLKTSETQDLREGATLSEMLLAPAAAQLSNQRLVIVGNGKLQLLPFTALPQGQDGQPLLLNHEIITLPSISSLAVQRKEWEKRASAPKTLAILADPVFNNRDERLGDKVESTSQELSTFEALTRAGCSPNLERLPYTAQEANNILAKIPDAEEFSALGFEANRNIATNTDLQQYQMVHLATHGCIQDNPLLSGLALSRYDDQGNSLDSFLRLQDVFNLQLNADLVVLSACETGTGDDVQGEGVVGLTRGFMYAGARRVVVSLWSVNDTATASLMENYYEKMLQDNLDPVAALRTAQLEMWNSGQWKSPYYWAAFTLQGDWLTE